MQYEYIIDEKGRYFVPRLPSFCDARAREEVIKSQLGVEALIVAPVLWKWLKKKYEVKTLL